MGCSPMARAPRPSRVLVSYSPSPLICRDRRTSPGQFSGSEHTGPPVPPLWWPDDHHRDFRARMPPHPPTISTRHRHQDRHLMTTSPPCHDVALNLPAAAPRPAATTLEDLANTAAQASRSPPRVIAVSTSNPTRYSLPTAPSAASTALALRHRPTITASWRHSG